MPDEFLYLETIGRRTGQPREIEIWFVERAGRYYILSEHADRSHWYRNVTVNPSVMISIGTPEAHESRMPRTPATGRALDKTRDGDMLAAVSALMDTKYRWSNGAAVELTPRED